MLIKPPNDLAPSLAEISLNGEYEINVINVAQP